MDPHHITGRNSWCYVCKHKTQEILYNWLTSAYPEYEISVEQKFPWCVNTKTEKQSRFDFTIEHLKIIIELDGRQHFEDTSNWDPAHITLKTDITKMKAAIENGYTIIRLIQEDVLFDNIEWQMILKENIKLRSKPSIVFIGELYQRHQSEMNNN
jgi:hypothetical protein